MLILGIETSCDETSAAIVKDGKKIISNVISSQIKIHEKYFGVVPELASRAHIENINWVVEAALRDAGIAFKDFNKKISAIGYTRGPGLAGALLVGQISAQTLSWVNKTPLVDINHIEGHLYAVFLKSKLLTPPYLGLIVSGGHTELIIVRNIGQYETLGGTRDDAAGEAFDKVAKLLNLGYPGGPLIEKLAERGRKDAVPFPRPYMRGSWDFSFSGLKTAVINYVKKTGFEKSRRIKNDICASFQQAVVDTLVYKTLLAAKENNLERIVIGGGVSANSVLRSELSSACRKNKLKLFMPDKSLCTDNAAMIAAAAYYKLKIEGSGLNGEAGISPTEPNMKLKNWKKR